MQHIMKNHSATPNTWKNKLVLELISLYLKVFQFLQTLPLLCRMRTGCQLHNSRSGEQI